MPAVALGFEFKAGIGYVVLKTSTVRYSTHTGYSIFWYVNVPHFMYTTVPGYLFKRQ